MMNDDDADADADDADDDPWRASMNEQGGEGKNK